MSQSFLFGFTLLTLPALAYAQVNDVFDAELLALDFAQRLGYFFFLLAMAAFFWGLVKFISNDADSKEHEDGRKFIVGSLIAFVVLLSLWGIVEFVLVDTLGVNSAPVEYIGSDGIVVPS